MEQNERLLNVRQAAEALGVSPQLVYELCAAKKIRHERYGLGRGSIRIPEGALAEYRQRCTVAVEESVPPSRTEPVVQRKNGKTVGKVDLW